MTYLQVKDKDLLYTKKLFLEPDEKGGGGENLSLDSPQRPDLEK